eukprot:308049_1
MYEYNSNIRKISVKTSPSKKKSKTIKNEFKRNANIFFKNAEKIWNEIHKFNDKSANKNDTMQAIITLFSVSFLTFWIMVLPVIIGTFAFDSSLSLSNNTSIKTFKPLHTSYNDWEQSEGIDVKSNEDDLDSTLENIQQIHNTSSDSFEEHVGNELVNTVNTHCIQELHFELSEIATDSIIKTFETLLWNLSEHKTITLSDHNFDFVITKK